MRDKELEILLEKVKSVYPDAKYCDGGTGLDADFISVSDDMLIEEGYKCWDLSICNDENKVLEVLKLIRQMNEKICGRCKKTLPLDSFNNDNSRKGGLCGTCRFCLKKTRDENKEAFSGYFKKYYQENKEKKSGYDKNRYKTHKKEAAAKDKVKYNISKGVIVRPDRCEECNRECKPDAHHEDYNKPLDVVWLCRSCHVTKHRDKEKDNA